MMRRVVALVLLLPAGACGTLADRPAVQHEVVDSAGIQLVRNGAAADTIALTPDLSIGTVDGPEELQFFRVTALAVAPDGAVLVGDGSGTIREFDGAGGFVRSIGRRGDGPGEFQRPSAIHVYGDTVAVVDGSLDRITEFDRTGTVLQTSTYRHESTVIYPVARVDGEWLVSPWESGWKLEVGRTRRDTTRVVRAGRLTPQTSAGDGPAAQTMQPVVEYETGRTYGIAYGSEGMTASSPLWEPRPTLLEWTREGTRQDSFWDVFDHEGRFLATVHLPAAFTARAAAGRSLYGVLRDDMDVEHIARFTLPSAS